MRDENAADVGELGVRERGAFGARIEGTEERFQKASNRAQSFPEAEVEFPAVGSRNHESDIVGGEIVGETFRDFLKKLWDELFGGDVPEQIDDAEQAVFAEHFAVGIAGFDECVGVFEDAVAGFELDVEMIVVGEREDAERNVERALFFGAVFLREEGPAVIGGAKKKRAGMAGVADAEPAAGREKSGDDGGGESALTRESGELLVEETYKFFVVKAIYEAAHQGAQVRGGGSDGFAVTGNIGEEQPADAAGRATGNVVDVAATLGLAERLAVNPDVEAGEFDSAGGDLAAAPDFHALHVLYRRSAHLPLVAIKMWNTLPQNLP